jgi:hypothetical protein
VTVLLGSSVRIPTSDGWREVTLREPREWTEHPGGFESRVAFAAAHVVADPLGNNVPGAPAAVDWDETLAFRRHLFSYGFGVAEAMDTAQRNMGLDYAAVTELVRRSAAQANELGARIASGAGTDQIVGPARDLDQVTAAYLEQVEMVEAAGSQVILMASRHLAALARTPDDYHAVYERVLSQVSEPVILHWLGEMFDPALAGYWGARDLDTAMEVCLRIIQEHAAKVDGIKISLLDREREIAMRRRLPQGVRMYTGDDFNYDELIRGDEHGYSHALLGIFDAIAPAAAAALHALDAEDFDRYEAILRPTIPLSRHIFQPPTRYYKTGVVFMAYLNGHQSHFRMVGGQESARSIVHLAELFMLADRAGLLVDPERATRRMWRVLAVAGLV